MAKDVAWLQHAVCWPVLLQMEPRCHCFQLLQAHKAEDFKWWSQRLGRAFQLYDETRVDHFRGFAGGHRRN